MCLKKKGGRKDAAVCFFFFFSFKSNSCPLSFGSSLTAGPREQQLLLWALLILWPSSDGDPEFKQPPTG